MEVSSSDNYSISLFISKFPKIIKKNRIVTHVTNETTTTN